ncbi:MAG: bifunctional helix-turn-helix transcriptional regulator/GNAT family N-acetyltransferase [Pseudomonadota bacterium]
MAADILSDLSYLALASRLKRLADALLADAAKIHADFGAPLQPGQFPLIAALDRYGPMTINDAVAVLGISQPATTRAVSELVKAGLVASDTSDEDKRVRTVSLTKKGRASVADLKQVMWPRVEMAARQMTRGTDSDFLTSIAEVESQLKSASMVDRVRANTLRILPFTDELADAFKDINTEWLEAMFSVEPKDKKVLGNPRASIIDKGGEIYFVGTDDGEVLGTCALEQEAGGYLELTKMGVREIARGRGAGEFLLRAVIERVRELGRLSRFFLVSNKRNVAALALYEKLGFVHDDTIMAEFGDRYERCDVAMRFIES